MRSTVYLIGAGPGAPDLITLRGFRCLQKADVVIFDHMVHPRLLAAAPAAAERIDVGSAAPQPTDQEAICYLLLEKAREGKTVARLKWGDPFLFDHGGEEALFLHEQGVPFEVVPGVPTAIGASAYAGIPITYPGGGDTVTFVRGHEDEGREKAKVDWDSLAQLEGTIVCYAGPRQLPRMLDALVSHGRSPDEPAAVIVNGTLFSQRTTTGTLGELAHAVKEHPVGGAALLIVGKVVNFRDHLRWFDSRPLYGRRVLVMHSKEQPDDLAELLEDQGAEAIVDTNTKLDIYRQLLDCKIDAVTFTTASAVLGFAANYGVEQASDLLAHTVVATLGPAAADAAGRAGITPAIQLQAGTHAAFADAVVAHFRNH
ncbi:MAG: uroporphyrinogen-III C-methyltransferase [Acidobacteria bacterium RIFCSPLOWO2_12_FULL_67_14b]|nr:MAG: uroporphyrinogen-III C-methyltransferase [Acidobacteria bacterium RIFCSPLOWO2_12_FULL_67_14b]